MKLPSTDDRAIGDIINSSPRKSLRLPGELGLAFATHTTLSCLTRSETNILVMKIMMDMLSFTCSTSVKAIPPPSAGQQELGGVGSMAIIILTYGVERGGKQRMPIAKKVL